MLKRMLMYYATELELNIKTCIITVEQIPD